MRYYSATPDSLPFSFENHKPGKYDSDEEDNVYPLSKKYDRNKDLKMITIRYILLVIVLIIFVINVLSSLVPDTQTFPVRMGYFANQITTKHFKLTEFTEIAVETKNCVVYLLEGNKNSDKVEVYVSSDRPNNIDTGIDGSKLNVKVKSSITTVRCNVEITIPGGTKLSKLSFNYTGDRIPDLLLYDYKDESTWQTPLIIDQLKFTISDAYLNVYFENQHQVNSLIVSGTY
jgi:hypothetical protein